MKNLKNHRARKAETYVEASWISVSWPLGLDGATIGMARGKSMVKATQLSVVAHEPLVYYNKQIYCPLWRLESSNLVCIKPLLWWPKCRSQWSTFSCIIFLCQIFTVWILKYLASSSPFSWYSFWASGYIYPNYVKMTLVGFIKIGIKSLLTFCCPSVCSPSLHVWTISCYSNNSKVA